MASLLVMSGSVLRHWGKAGKGLEEGSFHPLAFHNLGVGLWTELLAVQLRHPAGPIPAEGSWEDWRDLLDPWISAAAGHHGRPPLVKPSGELLRRQFPPDAERDALAWVRSAAAVWLPGGLPFPLEPLEDWEERFRRASWLFAGRRARGGRRSSEPRGDEKSGLVVKPGPSWEQTMVVEKRRLT